MTRPIKFRQPITLNNGKFDGWHYWGYTEGHLAMFRGPLSSNNGEIKRSYEFTGLLDKNGKEIYEGDIVKYKEWTKFHESVLERKEKVEWHEGLCGFTPMVYHTVVEDGFYNNEVEDIEIIGNIYENPELLK